MNKKWLWIPFVGLLAAVILIGILAIQSIYAQLSDPFGGIFMIVILVPVILLSLLGFAIFAYVAGKNETPKNSAVTLNSRGHGTRNITIGLVVLFVFIYCMWTISNIK